jgi:RNA polymerase sigma factor (sigma-70 family)
MSTASKDEFSAWVSANELRLTQAARAVCFDIQIAEDVLQEALADIFRRWEKIKDHEHLEAYVVRVMVSKHANIRRKYARKRESQEISIEVVGHLLETADDSDAIAERLLVQGALRSLTAIQRAVLLLVYENGLTIKEAASQLEIPTGTLASHLARGRAAVREYIQFAIEPPRLTKRAFRKRINELEEGESNEL